MLHKKINFRWTAILSFVIFSLLITACKQDENFNPIDNTDDTYEPNIQEYDYDADRADIANFYESNINAYWARYGFPPLGFLSELRASLGDTNPNAVFADVFTAFDQQRFFLSLESGQLPPEVMEAFFNNPSSNPAQTVLASILQYLEQLKNAEANGDVAMTEQVYFSLEMLTAGAFSPEGLLELTILDNGGIPTAFLNIDICFSHSHGLDGEVMEPPADGGDDGLKVKWDSITGIHWKTDYNGACGTVATGACAHKLGLIDDDVDCKEWNDISKDIGAKKGGLGATIDGISSYFKGKGYGRTTARDTDKQSAAQEAKSALARGCDVMIWYKNGDKAGHIEVVTEVTVDATNPKKGTMKTLSWGQSATTTFESNKFSGKSDGNRYGSGGKKSWLEEKGDAEIIYFCKD